MTVANPACPLCAAPATRRVFTKDTIDYWSCRRCGFRFSTPAANANFASAIDGYEAAYLQYLAPDANDEVNFDSVWTWMERLAPIVGRRLLDVGVGSGKFVRYLRGRGVDAHGIEPSRPLFDRFLAADAAFSCETVDSVAARGDSFCLVTAFDVVEHVADPVAFLRGLAGVLAPDGVVFLSTPDVESVPARVFGRRWHFYYRYHLSYFGPRTLARAAEAHGLRMIDCRHCGRERSIGYVIRYAAEFIAGIEPPRWARTFDAWHLPINLFDTMYVALMRDEP